MNESEYWNMIAEQKYYKSVSDEMLDNIFNLLNLNTLSTKIKFVEVGCGTGEIGKKLSKQKIYVTGIDISEAMIKRNKQSTNKFYECYQADVENFIADNYYDGILCIWFLHHIKNIERCVFNFSKWLKSGGKVYVVEPNGNNIINYIFKKIKNILCLICPELIYKYKLASPNEVMNYSKNYYINTFLKYNFKLVKHGGFNIWNSPNLKMNILSIIGFIRYILSYFTKQSDNFYFIFEKTTNGINYDKQN